LPEAEIDHPTLRAILKVFNDVLLAPELEVVEHELRFTIKRRNLAPNKTFLTEAPNWV
jgi:hypothetical protein